MDWLDKRSWDQKMKDKEYFKKFDDKPLNYLKLNDKDKYEKKLEEIGEVKKKEREKKKIQ